MANWWNSLSSGKRRLIIAAAVVETSLKAAVLLDLRRLASQVRGPRKLWAASMLVNSAGLIPISYFVFGRRRDPDA